MPINLGETTDVASDKIRIQLVASVYMVKSLLFLLLAPSRLEALHNSSTTMPSNDGVLAVARAFRILIIGGSYGGLATALTLIDLARGRLPRFNSRPDATPPQHRIPIKITVVDERDGYCKHPIAI